MLSRNLIPSTSMLVAFDSVAKTKSFTKTAIELNLTQGAISRQIKSLEIFLGIKLFKRGNVSVFLTKEGMTYAKKIHIALLRINTASLYLKTISGSNSGVENISKANNSFSNHLNTGGLLNIAILPTFGTRWLIPRFSSFLQQYPKITANFIFKPVQFDMESEDIHCAIHYGLPNWQGGDCTFLMNEKSTPVATPAFIELFNLEKVSDFRNVPLIHLKGRSEAWKKWINKHHKLTWKDSKGSGGLIFEQLTAVIQATLSGLGIALLPKILIENEIKNNDLKIISNYNVSTSKAYYFVANNQCLQHKPIFIFRDWLISQINIQD